MTPKAAQAAPVRACERETGPTRRHGEALVDAGTTRGKVEALRAKGMGWDGLASASGVSVHTLKALFGVAGRPPTVRVRASVEAAVLAVTMKDKADCSLVDSAKTWEMIDWLLANGWTRAEVLRRVGLSDAFRRRPRVTYRTARRVQQLYRGAQPKTVTDRMGKAGGPRPQRRFDFAPLDDPEVTDEVLAERLGITPGQVERWRTQGVPERSADAVAVADGRHPFELWDDFYDED